MTNKKTYLLPIWVDITSDYPRTILKTLNEGLNEFFRAWANKNVCLGNESVDIKWSVNEHILLKEDTNADR